MHAIDPDAAGLAAIGRPDGYLRRQVRRFTGLWEVNRTRDLPLVAEVGAFLAETVPESGPATVVHGDYRVGNLLVAAEPPARVTAILDWELATLGDPLADLGYLVSTYVDRDVPPRARGSSRSRPSPAPTGSRPGPSSRRSTPQRTGRSVQRLGLVRGARPLEGGDLLREHVQALPGRASAATTSPARWRRASRPSWRRRPRPLRGTIDRPVHAAPRIPLAPEPAERAAARGRRLGRAAGGAVGRLAVTYRRAPRTLRARRRRPRRMRRAAGRPRGGRSCRTSPRCSSCTSRCRRRGAVLVPMNVRMTGAGARLHPRALRRARPRGAPEPRGHRRRGRDRAARGAAPGDHDPRGAEERLRVRASGSRAPHRVAIAPPADENALLSINYTSGTTGRPKGVMYTHRGAYLHTLGVIAEARLDTRSAYLWTLPMFHCNGWAFTWAVTAMGGEHRCLARFDAGSGVGDARPRARSAICAARRPCSPCSAVTRAPPRLGREVRVFVGGAPPSPALLRTWRSSACGSRTSTASPRPTGRSPCARGSRRGTRWTPPSA